MSIRSLGALDYYFAGHVASSRRNSKVIAFLVSGENPDVDTAFIEDVWETGGLYELLTSAENLTLVSTDANDNAGLGGIETVTLTGTDENYDLQVKTYSLNGLTPVVTGEKWLRVFIMTGEALGAPHNTKAQGLITAKFAANTQAAIFQGRAASNQSMITVLRGYTGFIGNAHSAGGSGDDFIMRFAFRKENGIFVSRGGIEIIGGSFAFVAFSPEVGNMQEQTDLKVEAQSQGQNSRVMITFLVTMIRNDYLQSLADSM